MKSRLPTLFLCSALALATMTAHAGGTVEVRYLEPGNFADLKSTWLTQENLLATLSAHLQAMGGKYLPDGQQLEIDMTDIDLAGSIEYRHNGNPVRVMREVTSPHITLRWRIQSADKSVPMQEVTLRDTVYLTRINQYHEGDPLRYEKQMLEDWFKRAFVAAK